MAPRLMRTWHAAMTIVMEIFANIEENMSNSDKIGLLESQTKHNRWNMEGTNWSCFASQNEEVKV
jgi:hypothetical protein